MMKATTLLFALTTLVFVSTTTLADDAASERKFKHKPTEAPAFFMKKQLGQLELTEQQQAQIQTLLQDQRAKMQENKPERPDRQAFKELMDAPQFDVTTARALLEKQQQGHLERQLQSLQLQHQIRQVLTAEQREKLDNLRHKKRGERPEHRPHVKPAA